MSDSKCANDLYAWLLHTQLDLFRSLQYVFVLVAYWTTASSGGWNSAVLIAIKYSSRYRNRGNIGVGRIGRIGSVFRERQRGTACSNPLNKGLPSCKGTDSGTNLIKPKGHRCEFWPAAALLSTQQTSLPFPQRQTSCGAAIKVAFSASTSTIQLNWKWSSIAVMIIVVNFRDSSKHTYNKLYTCMYHACMMMLCCACMTTILLENKHIYDGRYFPCIRLLEYWRPSGI